MLKKEEEQTTKHQKSNINKLYNNIPTYNSTSLILNPNTIPAVSYGARIYVNLMTTNIL